MIYAELNDKDKANFDYIVKLLEDNEKLIKYDYKGRENQISITKELKNKIYEFVEKIKQEDIGLKEYIKYAVREAFELQDKDIVIIRQDQIFIKLFDKIKKHEINDEDKGTIASRYNGIDEAELQEFDKEFFSNKENKDFFHLVAQLFVELSFLDKKIDNESYEKNVFPIIQSLILEQLVDTFDHNEEFFIGFSGFIFRKHFKEVFEHIADFILVEVSKSNAYMIDFLKYYSLNMIVINGIKYKVPELEAENGNRWNAISIMAISKVYTKLKFSMNVLKKEIDKIEDKIDELYIGKFSPIEYKNLLMKKQAELAEKMSLKTEKLGIYNDSLKLSRDKDAEFIIQKNIDKIKNDMKHLREKRVKIVSKMVKVSVIKEYNDLEKEVESKIRQLKAEEKILYKNADSYKSIKHVLTKVLTSKKKAIK